MRQAEPIDETGVTEPYSRGADEVLAKHGVAASVIEHVDAESGDKAPEARVSPCPGSASATRRPGAARSRDARARGRGPRARSSSAHRRRSRLVKVSDLAHESVEESIM